MLPSTLSDLARQSLAALRILVVFTLILGVAYPLVVWAAGRAVAHRADGQPIRVDGEIVGSAVIGQHFEGDKWFHSRPSANDYDTLASAPSNLGPLSESLETAIAERRAEVAETEGVAESSVPPDALTGSGSGLDPHISPAYADLQAARVAQANNLSVATVTALVEKHTQGRFLGLHGAPAVNVLQLNVAVQEARG